jgi:threonine/homoserine/homoserine lactone efflux protein
MLDVLGQILPLAVAVSISPVQIIAVILLLFSERPRANAAALVVGFVVGVAGVLGVLVLAASTADLAAGTDESTGVAWGRMVLGVLLLAAAVRKFRSRPGPGDPPSMPSWMEGMQSFSPGRSLVTGAALGAANPKMVAMALAAAATIASAGLPGDENALVIAVYTAIATVGVAAPLVAAVAMGDRSGPVLDAWRDWLVDNNATVMAVLFLVFGVVLIGQGLQSI